MLSERIKGLLFVRNEDGDYRGWRSDLLIEKIEKFEEKFLFCRVCRGLVREACLYDNAGRQELSCSLCLPKDVTIKTAKINRKSVNEKYVECPLREIGCEWNGCLIQVLMHVNECDFYAVDCPLGCVIAEEKSKTLQIERRFLEEHLKVNCPMRLINCEYCDSQIKMCDMDEHIQICEEYLITCSNSCIEREGMKRVKRKDLPSHLGEDCPLQEVECPYAEYGCDEKMERRLVGQHEKESIHKHFRNSTSRLKEQSNQIKLLENENIEIEMEIERIEEFHSEEISQIIKDQRDNVTKLKKLMSFLESTLTDSPKGTLNWKISGVIDKIRESGTTFSETFSAGLYKCQCSIVWDYERRGYVGCFLHILKGDWDDKLKFPFKWTYTFTIISRNTNSHNYARTCEIDENDWRLFPKCFERPKGFGNSGFGMVEFITHEHIQTDEFMDNDSILLKIKIG